MNTTAAFAMRDPTQVSEARRAAGVLAHRLGFSEARAGQVALVVTELGTNLARHAVAGEILLRGIDHTAEPAAIEVLALDKGPGIADLQASRRDGHSTAGSLGHGLGAIERQSDYFEVYTQPSGTVALARIRRDPAGSADGQALPIEIGAVQVSMPGEIVCGDDWSWRLDPGRLSIVVADGLGHGLSAQDAAREAVATFQRRGADRPLQTLEAIHAALRAFRGAAVAVLAVDLVRGEVHHAGLGNISTVVVMGDASRHSLISHNGTAGHAAYRLQEFTSPFRPDCTLVMHSDGLAAQWTLSAYPGLRGRHPSVIAGVLYRDFARRRDDVTVVVARARGAR